MSELELGEAPAWARLDGEPSRAHEAFRAFRDLGPGRRLEAVAEGAGVRPSTVRRWSARWEWQARADAWDDEVHRLTDVERLEAVRTMHVEHRRAGRTAMVKALEALELLEPAQIPASAAARLLELGSRLERDTLAAELLGADLGDAGEDPWDRIARELTA